MDLLFDTTRPSGSQLHNSSEQLSQTFNHFDLNHLPTKGREEQSPYSSNVGPEPTTTVTRVGCSLTQAPIKTIQVKCDRHSPIISNTWSHITKEKERHIQVLRGEILIATMPPRTQPRAMSFTGWVC